jgi:hypothetical protein
MINPLTVKPYDHGVVPAVVAYRSTGAFCFIGANQRARILA